MKGKAIIPLVLGLCVGLVAVKFLVDKIQQARGASTDRTTITTVLATQDLDSYEEITPEMVELVTTVDNALIRAVDRITTLEEVVGRVTAKAIPQHAPVLASMLAPEGTLSGMRGRIQPGFRAVSVKIDEVTGVAYQIKPGDWVDVIVVMDVDSVARSRQKETIAEVILQHVQVLAMGQGTQTAQESGGAMVKPAKSATLLVAEEDVPKLHLAGTRGKITLSMRGADDQMSSTASVARGSEVFSSLGATKPEASPKGAPSFLDAIMRLSQAKPEATPRQSRESTLELPHGITVFRGSATEDIVQAERITFENSRSRTIIGISEGALSPAESMLAQRTRRSRFEPRTAPGRARGGKNVEPQSEPDSNNVEVE